EAGHATARDDVDNLVLIEDLPWQQLLHRRSVLPHVALDLPRADALDVLLPFTSLGVDVPLVDVLAQRIAHDPVLLQVVEGLVEIAGEIVDAVLATFAVAHAGNVLVDGIS